MISHTIHSQLYEKLTWEEIGVHAFTLAQKIIEGGEKFDRIVALARGGVSIAQTLSDLLGIKQISVIRSEFYTGINSTTKAPIITESLSISIKNEKILLIDDLADTGESLLFARQYLYAHGPSEIKTATLASKPWTKLTPDYFIYSSNAWVIFPWETRETIKTVTAIWKEKGDSTKQIRAQLELLGYSASEVKLFVTP